jgi:hypothetical protein
MAMTVQHSETTTSSTEERRVKWSGVEQPERRVERSRAEERRAETCRGVESRGDEKIETGKRSGAERPIRVTEGHGIQWQSGTD